MFLGSWNIVLLLLRSSYVFGRFSRMDVLLIDWYSCTYLIARRWEIGAVGE